MRKIWYNRLRTRLPFRRVPRVKEVTFRFCGLGDPEEGDVFVGTYDLLNRLLEGLAFEGSGIYSSRDVLENCYWDNPRIGDVTFRGYKITEEWEDMPYRVAMLLAVTLTVGSSFFFRAVFGDWQTAIGASSLVAAVIALGIQWMIYLSSKD
ncbi:hypothetical protein VTG60DRAFT_4345 [Thermothelomyces hinnuleus]